MAYTVMAYVVMAYMAGTSSATAVVIATPPAIASTFASTTCACARVHRADSSISGEYRLVHGGPNKRPLASLLVDLAKIRSSRPAGSVEHRQGLATRGTSPQTEHPNPPRPRKKIPLPPTLHRP